MKTRKKRRVLKKSIRKTIAALLMITALIVAAIPGEYISAQTEENEVTEDYSVGVVPHQYEYHADDGIVYYITSNNYVADYTYETSPLNGTPYTSKDQIKVLNIPDVFYTTPDHPDDDPGTPIEGIAQSAFKDCVYLQQVKLPLYCKEVGDNAMEGATGLVNVTTNENLKTIGDYAFSGASSLRSCNIPAAISSIGRYAFQDTAISSATLPSGELLTVEEGTFQNCAYLNSITLGDSIKKIGLSAFSGCSSLDSITIPSSLNTLENSAFQNCTELKTVNIPNQLQHIGTYIFDGCSSLSTITFDPTSKLAEIPQGTFRNCSGLRSIELPESITSINNTSFQGCSGLEEITLPEDLPELYDGTFEDCKNLFCITIPGNTRMPNSNQFMNMNNGSFRIRGNLNTNAYNYARSFNICFQTMDNEFEEKNFRVNSNGELTWVDMAKVTLTSNYVDVPEQVGDIVVRTILASTDVFKGNGDLVGINIPNTVTSIASDAFNGCQNLTRATIDSEDTSIGTNAFKGVNNEFIMYGTISDISKPYNYAMENSIVFVNNGTYFKVKRDDATGYNTLIDYDTTTSDLVIPAGIDAFGYKTDGSVNTSIFDGNNNLRSLSIGDAVCLKDHEFANCSNLSSVSLPATLTKMGKAPFIGCSSLANAQIASNNPNYSCENGIIYEVAGGTKTGILEMLGGSSGNTNFTVPNTITSIEPEAFANLDNLSQITFTDGVSVIPQDCFRNSSIVIANLSPAVKRIDEGAFANTRISEIHIPEETTYISDTATQGVTGLTVYGVKGTTAEEFAHKFGYTFVEEGSKKSSSSTSSTDSSSSKTTNKTTSKTTKKTSTKKTTKKTTSTSKKSTSSTKSTSTSSTSSSSSSSSSSVKVITQSSNNITPVNKGNATTGGAGTGGNANVDVGDSGLENKDKASGSIEGSPDNYVVKISKTNAATSEFEDALKAKYGKLDNLRSYPMDISLYDSTGTTKIDNPQGVSVTLTLPIPEELALYGGNNRVAAVSNGSLEELGARFSAIDGTPCITFTANHFSTYGLYVDVSNLSAGDMLDSTPTTGDPISPKWFLAIGLAALSILLFMKRDPVIA